MFRNVLAFLFLSAAATTPVRAAVALAGATARPPLDHAVGEAIVFAFAPTEDGAPCGGRVVWTMERDGAPGVHSNGVSVVEPGETAFVTASLDRPGFVRVSAALLDEAGARIPGASCRLAAGAGVADLRGADEPDDFDAFWSRVRAEADAADLSKAFAAPAPDAVSSRFPGFQVRAFRAPFSGPAAPATGWALWRTGAPHRSLPLEVRFDDYGVGDGAPPADAADEDALVVCVNAHGFELGRDRAYYISFMNRVSNGGNGGGYGFRNAENDNPETCYFRGMVARDLLALRFARSLPQWDGRTLRVSGTGQGGFQAIAAAALDPAVTSCRADEPWLCDLAAADFGRYGGWRPAFRPALRYYDAANLAARVTCTATVFCPAASDRCPPSGVMVLYNRLAGPKHLLFVQNARRLAPDGAPPSGAATQLLERE